ncbi:MAG: GNAT family N-acetyltransferase [Pseudomonadota bacterium]
MNAHLADTPVLETERLLLRAPQAGDYPAWRDFLCSARGNFVGGGSDVDVGRAWRAFSAITGHWTLRGFGMFVFSDRGSGQPLGACGPWYPEDWPEREIGWSVWHPSSEGNGYAQEAARAVLSHVFSDLGWATAVSYIDAANIRSQNLARRLGAALDRTASRPDPDDLVFRHRPGAATP